MFSLSGEIQVDSRITCSSPYLTIAGQTAPGGGIMVSNRNGPNLDGTMRLAPACDDAVIRHVRFRPGPPPVTSTNVNALQVESSRVVIDHASFSWSNDQTLNVIGNGGITGSSLALTAGDVTVQDSFIFAPLNNANHISLIHAFATFFSGGIEDLSVIRTAIAHAVRRAPLLEPAGHVEWINNLVYNSQNPHGELYTKHGAPFYNMIGSLSIRGPDTLANSGAAFDIFKNGGLNDGEIFIGGAGWPMNLSFNAVLDPKDTASANPVGFGISVPQSSIRQPLAAYSAVLTSGGALPRDPVDARVVNEIRNCTGPIKTPAEIVYPTLASAPAPGDADRDGIADAFENANGLNPADAADRNGDLDGDGFTNLEEYLNGLSDALVAAMPAVPEPTALPCGSGALIASPSITSFTVSKAAVRPGEAVTISWATSGASTCAASGPPGFDGSVPCTGSATVSFPADSANELDLTATSGNYTEIEERIVYVNATGTIPAPDIELTASSATLTAGQLVTLNWREARGDRQLLSAQCLASSPDAFWSGYKSVGGRQSFEARRSGAYSIQCTGPGGADTASVTLTVN